MTARQTPTPQVGIVYLVDDKLWIDATPVGEASGFADFKVHDGAHIDYWEQLVGSRAVPEAEYEEYPRGRVAFNTKTEKYTLLADPCILGRKKVVNTILEKMHLPIRSTEFGTDPHYRCWRCLGKSRSVIENS